MTRIVRLGCAAGLLGLVAACSLLPQQVEEPEFPHRLPPRIDSLVFEPFTRPPAVPIAEADVRFFQDDLRKALALRPGVRTFDAPPNGLPGVAIVSGSVTAFALREDKDPDFYLRTIDLSAEITVRFQASDDPPTRLARNYAYQKLYLPQETVATPLFDTQSALLELSALFAQALLPDREARPVTLLAAQEPAAPEGVAVPALLKANRFAVENRFERAVPLWEMVLYRPEDGSGEPGYRVSRRALVILEREGMAKAELERLEPLAEKSPDWCLIRTPTHRLMCHETAAVMPFAELRDVVRERLAGRSAMEDRILELADEQVNRVHLNLASAHHNLAEYYYANLQRDLAAYHYAMAYAHFPSPENLRAWAKLQAARNLMPGNLQAREAIRLYLRLPPPSTVHALPGRFAEEVLPPSALRQGAIQERIDHIKARKETSAVAGVPLPPPAPAPPAAAKTPAPAAPQSSAGAKAPAPAGNKTPAAKGTAPKGAMPKETVPKEAASEPIPIQPIER